MLVMFAAGVANLAWMAALSGVMLYEKVAILGVDARQVGTTGPCLTVGVVLR